MQVAPHADHVNGRHHPTRKKRSTITLAAVSATLLIGSACSSGKSASSAPSSSSASAGGTQSSSAPAASSSAAASTPAKSSITVTMGDNSSPDMDYLPLEMALKTMSSSYNVKKTILFNDDTTALQALQQNTIQFMTESVPPASKALAQLPNIIAVGTRANNQWDMVSKADITDCNQLSGKRLGLFSKTGVSTAYVNMYLKANCPNAKPQIVIIPDSGLRRQALEAGQLDATPLQATDSVQILNGSDKAKFHELVNFATALPGIGRDLLLTNKQTLQNHPDVVEAFLAAQLKAIRQIYSDPSQIPELMTTYLPGAVPTDQAAAIGDYFVQRKLFCANGGVSDSGIADELKAFQQGGFSPNSVTMQQLVDPAPMQKVLTSIGKSDTTSC